MREGAARAHAEAGHGRAPRPRGTQPPSSCGRSSARAHLRRSGRARRRSICAATFAASFDHLEHAVGRLAEQHEADLRERGVAREVLARLFEQDLGAALERDAADARRRSPAPRASGSPARARARARRRIGAAHARLAGAARPAACRRRGSRSARAAVRRRSPPPRPPRSARCDRTRPGSRAALARGSRPPRPSRARAGCSPRSRSRPPPAR